MTDEQKARKLELQRQRRAERVALAPDAVAAWRAFKNWQDQ
jgi:hypothetical protein